MTRCFIDEIKCGVGEDGVACGPVSAPSVAEIKVIPDEGETFYLCLAEVSGLPHFYKTEESIYEVHMDIDADIEVFEKINEHFLDLGSYEDIFENPEMENYDLYKLLIALVRADWDELYELKKNSVGKYIDEIDIPVSDIEEEYLAEYLEE